MKKKDQVVTILGKGTEFEGKLKFHGTIRIDGDFKGEIESDGNLIVGEEGMVEADMHVAYIVISGEIHGNITADQRVDIRAPGKVFGNIQAPAVVIDEGVIFEGTTRMYQAKEASREESTLVDADEYTGGPPRNLTAISGIVSDEQTKLPIKNARINLRGDSKKRTETNASGYYELINLKEGKWKMRVEAKGYRRADAPVDVIKNETFEQNFELAPR